MTTARRYVRYSTRLVAALVLVAGMQPRALPQSGDYLRELEDEASDLTVDPQTREAEIGAASSASAAPAVPSPPGGGAVGYGFAPGQLGMETDLPPGLDRAEFENALRMNFIGSYAFYKRLSEESRARVFGEYQATADVDAVRDKIQAELKAK